MKRISTISYAPPQSGSTNTGGKDAFIFSSDITDWITSNKVKYNPRIDKKDHKPNGGRRE